MADDRKSKILLYISLSEYLRQSARNIAREIFADFSAQELLTDPSGAAQELVDLLVVRLRSFVQRAVNQANSHAVALGLASISSADRELLVNDTIEEIHGDSEAKILALITAADDRVQRMLDDGVDESVAEANLKSEAGKAALFVGLLAALQASAAGFISEAERKVSEATGNATTTADPAAKMRWSTVGDGRECSDVFENSCDMRDGLEMTLDEWRHFGLPGASNLLCSIYSRSGFSNCRCSWENAATPLADPGVINASDAIKAGRERANAERLA
jgi:hypothetical protein